MDRNIRLFPWFEFCRNLLFWQATWFLYLQNTLSAAEAILLYAIYDIATTVLEVPSGYMSDRVGRRFTLVLASLVSVIAMLLLALGDSFAVFVCAQILMGAGMAFVSGTDSALLYESLETEGRAAEIETQNLIAWRFSFGALAVSAATGGIAALWAPSLPFLATAFAFAAMFVIALQFSEPPHSNTDTSEWARIQQLATRFRVPALRWLFALAVVMYGFSHVPFVFGQPFIAEALKRSDLQTEASVVSGVVATAMMLVSLGVSLIAPALRRSIGLGPLLLLAFGLQVGLVAALSVSGSIIVIGFLLLRMVPDSLSTPFIVARVQPLLEDQTRATFLSMKSLVGRLVFAGSLAVAAAGTSAASEMTRAELQTVLLAYTAAGTVCFAVLIVTLRRVNL